MFYLVNQEIFLSFFFSSFKWVGLDDCRALLGSVSDHCAKKAKCPVLIVKRPKNWVWLFLFTRNTMNKFFFFFFALILFIVCSFSRKLPCACIKLFDLGQVLLLYVLLIFFFLMYWQFSLANASFCLRFVLVWFILFVLVTLIIIKKKKNCCVPFH